jgi:hypothetical protein
MLQGEGDGIRTHDIQFDRLVLSTGLSYTLKGGDSVFKVQGVDYGAFVRGCSVDTTFVIQRTTRCQEGTTTFFEKGEGNSRKDG